MRSPSLSRTLQRFTTLLLYFTMLGMLLGLPATAVTRADSAAPTGGELQTLQFEGALPKPTTARSLAYSTAPLGQGYQSEVEPNGTYTTATGLTGTNLVLRAPLFPNGDVDFYAFTANAGDRVYIATMTSFSAGSSTDSQLTVLDSDGTTVIEFDDDNGSLAGLSSSIAGATLPNAGTYYIKVNDFTAGTTSERPYELHFRLQSGTPTAEVEPNDTPATANALAASGWMTGTRNPALSTEQDWYSFSANAGDTVFLSLDVDPERDGVSWNGRLGLALFGDASNQILVVDDAGTGDVLPVPNRPSEALFMTVKNAGTYYAFVDSASAATGGPTATYNLSVSIHPSTDEGVSCTTYTSTDVPQAIGPNPGLASSTITVPGNPRIADIDVSITLTHSVMNQIDAHLRSPAGNDNGLFTDIGAAAAGGQTQMDLTLDDEAGIPFAFTVVKSLVLKPELNYRLSWFDGEDAGGTWTLDLRDDITDTNGGILTGWSLRICEPPPPPACPANSTLTTLFSTNFEANDGGFTHSGTQDEWEYGLPTSSTPLTNPISTCNSGTNCWKTDLDDGYNASSTQNLLSPAIPLTTTGLVGPIYFSWAQRYHIESANFDHASADVQLAGGGSATRLWEWLGATMNDTVGNPTVTIAESGGWGVFTKTLSNNYIGQNIEALFHLDSDNTVQLSGLAIDDVSVSGCVSTPNNPPNANAGNDQNVYVDSTVTLDGSASNDPDNNPLTYGWVQSGGPAVTLSSASAVSPTFTAPSTPTVVTFTLTVTDSLGASGEPSTVQVTVGDVPINEPGIDHDSPTLLGNTTHFSGTVATGTNVVYSWEFGDGNVGVGQYVTHTYALVGTYPITLTVSNGFGSGPVTSQVTVFDYRLYLPLIRR